MSRRIEVETTKYTGMDAANRVGNYLRDAICGNFVHVDLILCKF